MTVTVPAPAGARRLLPVLLRVVGLPAGLFAFGLLLNRLPSTAGSGPDFGPGVAWLAAFALAVVAGAAVDGRRHGFGWSVAVWTAAVAALSVAGTVRFVLDPAEGSLAERTSTVVGLLTGLVLPVLGMAVAAAAVASGFRRRARGERPSAG